MKNSKKNNKLIKILIPTIVGVLGITSVIFYLYLSAYPEGINMPLNESAPFVSYTFDAKEGGTIHQTTGTHIEIPKNAFVDEEGNKVKGKVELKFREFHNATDIMLSGIPMQMLGDRNQFMQSGGMMELRAFQNGKELQLDNGKKIKVDLAAFNKPVAGSDLFFLEEDKNWTDGGNFTSANNDRRDSALVNLPPLPDQPFNPEPDSTEIVFEIDASKKIAPHMSAFKGVKWRLITEPGQPIPYWAFRLDWNKVSLKEVKGEKGLFDITFNFSHSNYSGKTIKHQTTIQARPILSGKELKEAKKMYKEEYKNYEQMLANQKLEEDRLEQETAVLSRFEMDKMGIWNIDRILKMDVYATVEMEFDFQKEVSPIFNKILMIVIMEDLNAVIKINAFQWDDIPVIEGDTELLFVLPDGNVAFVSSEKYKSKINPNTVSKHFTNKVFFETEKLPMNEYLKRKKKKITQTKPSFI